MSHQLENPPRAAGSVRSAGPTYRQTVHSLSAAQKAAAPGAPAYSILVNRKVGRLLAAAAYRAGLSPNAVTGISALFTFTGITLVATLEPSWVLAITVWLALALGYAFDSADGQVARLRGGGSVAGEWLDHVVDALKISSLHLAVLITAYRHFDLQQAGWLLVPIGFCVVSAVSFFAMILNDHLKEIAALKSGAMASRKTGSRLRSILLIPTDYGFLCLAFLLLGSPVAFFVLYAVLFAANTGHLGLAAVKWFRDMQSLTPASVQTHRLGTSNE